MVYCLMCSYECDDYVLNDNAAGDLKILRSALNAIISQSFSGLAPDRRKSTRIRNTQLSLR